MRLGLRRKGVQMADQLRLADVVLFARTTRQQGALQQPATGGNGGYFFDPRVVDGRQRAVQAPHKRHVGAHAPLLQRGI